MIYDYFLLIFFNNLDINKYLYRKYTLIMIYELIVITVFQKHYQKYIKFINEIVHVTIMLMPCYIFSKPYHLFLLKLNVVIVYSLVEFLLQHSGAFNRA